MRAAHRAARILFYLLVQEEVNRHALYFLAVAIPALLHGLYDTFCQGSIMLAILISFVGVFLLMTYLKRSGDYQTRLKR